MYRIDDMLHNQTQNVFSILTVRLFKFSSAAAGSRKMFLLRENVRMSRRALPGLGISVLKKLLDPPIGSGSSLCVRNAAKLTSCWQLEENDNAVHRLNKAGSILLWQCRSISMLDRNNVSIALFSCFYVEKNERE
jgi:hypothetical protein